MAQQVGGWGDQLADFSAMYSQITEEKEMKKRLDQGDILLQVLNHIAGREVGLTATAALRGNRPTRKRTCRGCLRIIGLQRMPMDSHPIHSSLGRDHEHQGSMGSLVVLRGMTRIFILELTRQTEKKRFRYCITRACHDSFAGGSSKNDTVRNKPNVGFWL
ncbi:hypothetical protein VTK26DRAFT_3130 [Humicola hyalothermophila]